MGKIKKKLVKAIFKTGMFPVKMAYVAYSFPVRRSNESLMDLVREANRITEESWDYLVSANQEAFEEL